MKELKIPVKAGFCKNCFRMRKDGSAYCGNCKNEPPRKKIYQDDQKNFPLMKELRNIFPITGGTILTYGDTIYFDGDLPFHLVAHEITHILQQEKLEVNKWWDKYFKDNKFRLEQELEAYQNQYKSQRKQDEVEAAFLLENIAKDLSGKLYGEIISLKEAKELIKS